MLLRWIIRGFAFALVAVCLVAGAYSLLNPSNVEHKTRTSTTCLDSVGGQVLLSRWSDPDADDPNLNDEAYHLGWDLNNFYMGGDYGKRIGDFNPAIRLGRFLGFALWHRKTDGSNDHFDAVAIPYWFIDSAAILIGLYVWRKTRPKPNPATAFPVETVTP